MAGLRQRIEALITPERARFVRFCVVGASGVVVNLGVFSLFMYWVLPGVVPAEASRFVAANFAGFFVSVFTNFLLNDYWTWGDRKEEHANSLRTRLTKFYLVSSVAGGVQMGVAYAVRAWIIPVNEVAVLVGIGVATIINFVVNNIWTFK